MESERDGMNAKWWLGTISEGVFLAPIFIIVACLIRDVIVAQHILPA